MAPRYFLPYGLHWIDREDIDQVVSVLKSDWIVMGRKVEEFEEAVCKYVNCKYGIAVNSGTSALDIAIASLGLKKAEVITTPFTFVATVNAILFNNLKPVFADIQKDTYNIDPDDIRKKITAKTRAILYVDFAGHPCDIAEIKEIAEEHDLYLIEDAAHALGAEYRGKKVGSFADITIFSFHPVKHVTTGEGGMCVTNDKRLADRMRILRNHGIDRSALERFDSRHSWSYDVRLLGRNYRMTDFQAALGVSQLRKLDKFLRKRRELAETYTKKLQGTPMLTLPVEKPNVKHAWHLYTVLLDPMIDRNGFVSTLRSNGIGATVHYPPVYTFTFYKKRGFKSGDLPVTKDIAKRVLTLPLFPRMTKRDVNRVVDIVKETIGELHD